MDFKEKLLAEYDRETANTRKMLEAVPDDSDFEFKPHEKSMALGRLLGHLSETAGDWAIHTLTMDKLEFPEGHKFEPYIPKSKEAMLTQFDKKVVEAKAALGAFDGSRWDENWKFVAGGQAWIDEPRYDVWRFWVMNHMIHHRAQLGVYLRLLGQKLPGIYGPSADGM